MKPTLFLHVGYPKTGTSAIQWMLANNRARLADLGFHYPLMGHAQSHQPGGNGVDLANLLKGHPSPQGEADQQRLLDLLRAGSNHVIVSSELLAQAKPALLENFLQNVAQAGAQVQVIFYLRPYPSLIPSVWNQRVKSHGYAKDFADYQASLQPPTPSGGNWKATCACWGGRRYASASLTGRR